MSDTRVRTFRFSYPGTIKAVFWPGFGEVKLTEPIAVKAGDEISVFLADDDSGRLLEPPKVRP